MSDKWTAYANEHLKGRKIVGVRYMNADECEALGWRRSTRALTLDNGTIICPSSDDEGNEPGALFGWDVKNRDLTFPVV